MQLQFVSVIIPTYKDWNRLALCMSALSSQAYPHDMFEIIVVNNDPKDQLPANFSLPLNCTVITEAKPGSYAARNAALKIAKGNIIGFTDSDCIPDKDWIKNAVIYLSENPACSRVAGHISIFPKSSRITTGEKYDKVYAFPQKMYVDDFKAGVTGNLFVHRKVFDEAGFFDENLFSSGDLAWGRMAHKAGHAIHYVKNVVVQHPARVLKELVQKERRVGGGSGVAARQTPTTLADFITVINGFRPRLAEIKHIYKTETDLTAIDKIKVLFLRHYLLNVRSLEKLRVKLGKKPNRT